jgi:putative PIN family toxin of toxin-antitoxin system
LVDDWILVVVIDTNIWISALINPGGAPARLMQAVRNGQIRLALSLPLIAETDTVIRRDRIRRRIALDDQGIDAFLSAARASAIVVPVTGTLRLCRDAKDDVVVETAIVAGADYVVSRDEDLTRDVDLVGALGRHGVGVLTVARFLELLDADTA